MPVEHSHYGWKDSEPTCAHNYILPEVLRQVHFLYHGKEASILDIGCGNGYVAAKLAESGHFVVGIDVSHDGIEIARSISPKVQFTVCSLYDEKLLKTIGQQVDCIISLEVVEHLFYPKTLFEQSYKTLKKGGYFIISTPYHGYVKNLVISLVNGWDRHFRVDWDGGHIKFFSKRTLMQMACSVGFRNPSFHCVGRCSWLWKSMIMIAEK